MKTRLDNGLTITFDDVGHGPPLVLMHGFANDRSAWWPQVTGLSQAHRVITPDLRGFGESGPTDSTPISMDHYAEDVALLLDHLAISAAVIGGLSMGGYVTLAFAQKYPDRTKALLLANTRATADSEEGKKARLAMVRDLEQRGIAAVVEAFANRLLAPGATPAMQASVRDLLSRQPASSAISATLGMAERPDRRHFLQEISLPVLVISGTADIVIPPAETESIHDHIRHSIFVNIPDAGHLSNLDKPLEFNRAVEDFMASLS